MSATAAVKIPYHLKRRPRFQGMPIPYMTPMDANGRPQFGFDDLLVKERVIRERVCGQCGLPLPFVLALVGDEEAIKSRRFKEPGMHIQCARYALTVCPYFTKLQHRQRPPRKGESPIALVVEGPPLPPCERFGIFLTRGYSLVYHQAIPRLLAGDQVGTTIWYERGTEVRGCPHAA